MICHDVVSTFTTNYIHDTFIANGPGWIQSTWNWLMGVIGHSSWTLVDVVNGIWNLGSTAIDMVKDAANAALNAVKAGLEFIANFVLQQIVESMVYIFKNFIFAMTDIVSAIDGTAVVTKTSNGAIINGNELSISRSGLGISFVFGDMQLNIGDILTNIDLDAETLGISQFTTPFVITQLGTTVAVSLATRGPWPVTIASLGAMLVAFLYQISTFVKIKDYLKDTNIISAQREEDKSQFLKFLGGLISGLFSGIALTLLSRGISQVAHKISGFANGIPSAVLRLIAAGIDVKEHPLLALLLASIPLMTILYQKFDGGESSSSFGLGASIGLLDAVFGVVIDKFDGTDETTKVQYYVDFGYIVFYMFMWSWIEGMSIPVDPSVG